MAGYSHPTQNPVTATADDRIARIAEALRKMPEQGLLPTDRGVMDQIQSQFNIPLSLGMSAAESSEEFYDDPVGELAEFALPFTYGDKENPDYDMLPVDAGLWGLGGMGLKALKTLFSKIAPTAGLSLASIMDPPPADTGPQFSEDFLDAWDFKNMVETSTLEDMTQFPGSVQKEYDRSIEDLLLNLLLEENNVSP